MYMLMCWLGPMYGHVIHFFLFFCLVKLFFFLFVRISTIMVNNDEYIINTRMLAINVSIPNLKNARLVQFLTVTIRCMNIKRKCSQLAYWIGTPAVSAAQSGVHPLVNATLDFQKLKILTSSPVRRPNVRHRAKFREDRSKQFADVGNSELGKKDRSLKIYKNGYLGR